MQTINDQYLYLSSPRGYFIVHPDGNIQRTDMFHNPSGKWKMRGLSITYRNRRMFFGLHEITPEVLKLAGHKRVCDLDYGTNREWGDDLTSITFYDSLEQTPFYANGGRQRVQNGR